MFLDLISILLYFFIGFTTQYLDASIGLGYGTFSVPLLLLLGIPPIYVVPAVLVSKTVLGIISGITHYAVGNVERKVTLPLITAGILGTFVGVPITIILSNQETSALIGVALITVGCIGLLNVARGVRMGKYSRKKISISGFFAGLINGISGGGYGAVSTTGLISAGVKTRIAIGSTVLAETFVALTGVLLYLFFIRDVNWDIILALLLGGLIATPIGALTTKKSPSKKLGAVIAVLVILLGASSAIVRSEALVLGFVSAALILITYHFKMVGHRRIQIGMGGINLGIGACTFLFAYLYQTNVVLFNLATLFEGVIFWYLIFVGGIFVVAGILDFIVD
jgi:uncharacterized membrane protein YfcA